MKIEGAMNLSMQNEFEPLWHQPLYVVRRNVACTIKFTLFDVTVKITIKFKI
jgi:hypothetical protein